MADWNAHIPDFAVKAADKPSATAAAEKKVANHKAGLTVAKIVVPPPPPPPPDKPPFLENRKLVWADDASKPDPVGAERWSIYAMEARDHGQHSSQELADVQPGRFVQIPDGGPDGGPRYQFTAPNGDNIWTPGDSGRSEMSYPRAAGQASGRPGPHPDVVYFLEGHSYATLVSILLPGNWNVNAPSWRLLMQHKQSEWEDQRGLSPALAMEQRAGSWLITNFGGPTLWSMPAVADGQWIHFAYEVTYSADPSKGKLSVYADKDGDGKYEYASQVVTAKTLADNGSLAQWIPSTIHTGWYGGDAPGQSCETNYSIWS